MMMRDIARDLGNISLAILALVMGAVSAQAQGAADFYKGRNIDLYVGYSSGGGYDLYARLIARHMGKHIPGNPTVIVKNMEGAGSLRLANWLFNVAPKDGSVFGTIGRGTPFDPLFRRTSAQFDGPRFSWIGSANNEVSICGSWHTSGIAKFDDILSKTLIVGGTSASADTDQFPRVVNGVLGTKMKVITGYTGGTQVGLAMERGEVQGRCGWSWSSVQATHKHWLDEKKFNVFVQLALQKHADLPDVPLIVDLAKTDEQRQILRLIFARQVIGRPFLAPPGVPPDRLELLRKAFMETMTDKAFLEDAEKGQMEITPVTGADLQVLVQELYATPAAVIQKAAEMLK